MSGISRTQSRSIAHEHRKPLQTHAFRAIYDIFEVYEDLCVEAEEYVDAGDTIVVVARAHGTARGSGLHMDQRLAFVWTVREGKPVQMEQYPNREDALKAVDLEV